MDITIDASGMEPLRRKIAAFENRAKRAMRMSMEATLLVVWENVPPYPDPPATSTYTRTGTLGRSLGSSEQGGMGGQSPDILKVDVKGDQITGTFGTTLYYAPYVIGGDTGLAQSQTATHARTGWYTIPQTLWEKSEKKVRRIWDDMAKELVAWFEGRGA